MNLKNIKIQADLSANYDFIISSEEYHRAREKFYLERLFAEIDKNLCVTPETFFLEVGFNSGRHLEAWAERYPEARFLGLEVRESCISNMKSKGYDCRLVDEEIFDCNEKFDVIYGSGVLHHISKPYAYLDHVYSLLKPGGFLYFENEAHRYDFFDMLFITFSRGWKYEKNIFKLSKLKLIQHLSVRERESKERAGSSPELPGWLTALAEYDGMVFMSGFTKANVAYRKLRLHQIPFLNTIKIFIKK